MAKTVTFDVEVDSGNSVKTLATMKKELEDINAELEEVEVGSKAFNDLAASAAKASGEIKDIEKSFEGLDATQRTEAFAKGFEGIAGAVAVTAGTMAVFGVESERLGKLEEKVQGAIAIAIGARSVAEGIMYAAVIRRTVAEKASQVATKVSTGVQAAYNAVLALNPIGLIVIAVAALVAGFILLIGPIKKLISKFEFLNTAMEAAGKFLRFLGSAIGLVASQEELAAEKSKKASEQRVENLERELTIAKARGKDTIEIERNILREKKKLYKADSKEYKDLQTQLTALNAQRATEEKDKAESRRKERQAEWRKQRDDARKTLEEISLDAELIGLTETEKAIELENRKYEERLKVLKKFNLDTEDLEKIHQDELAKIEADAQKKKDDEAAAKRDEDNKKRIDEEKAYADLLLNIRDNVAVTQEQQRALELTKLTEHYDTLIAEAKKNGIDTENLEDAKSASIGLKKDEFRQNDTDKEKAYQDQIAQLAIGAASDLISTLSSLNELFAGESEEQQKKQFKRNQSLQIAQTVIDTYASATGAFNSLVGVPIVGPVLGGIAAAAAVAGGLANIKNIKSQKFEGASATGGSVPSGGGQGGGGGTPNTSIGSITPIGQLAEGSVRTPQFNQSQPAIKTYVLSGDVSNGQEADARINQRRTL